MKLSKVKKICVDNEELMVKHADTGIDVRTWIGCRNALYPVHGIEMTAALAVKIWEIDEKKQRQMYIADEGEGETVSLITRRELEEMPLMVDSMVQDDDEEFPGLSKIATVNGKVVLMDRETHMGWILREEFLEPVSGDHLMFIPLNPGENEVAVYADGILEGVFYCERWHHSDYMKYVFKNIAMMWRDSDFTEEEDHGPAAD